MTGMMGRAALLLGVLCLVVGCQSGAKRGVEIGSQMSAGEYARLLKNHTRQSVKYEGFYNKFEVAVVFLNSEVQSAMLQRKSDVFMWDQSTAQKEREKMFQENSTQTKFAVSFFTPSARINDLHKANSFWKIYLESGGQRYPGRAQRRNGKLEEVQALLPAHNRWSVAYDVLFDVPLSATESANSKFILTSTEGTAVLQFDKSVSSFTY